MSVYVTVKQHRKEKQITWEDILFDNVTVNTFADQKSNCTGTITRKYETLDAKYSEHIVVEGMIQILEKFNEKYEELFNKERASLYEHFKIPKKTGGWRPIDAPVEELQSALRELENILTEKFGILYHTSAFAYIPGRSIMDCVQKHQKNESMWYLKTDFSGFFPSTTLEFTMKMLSMVFPLSEICKTERGYEALKKALSLGFLNGGLPQGTVLSPSLTNMLMIPLDFELFNELAHRHIVYTRYADDMHISAQENFPWKEIVKLIRDKLNEFGAPYELKDEKTHYGNRKGRNWILGLMCNKDNNITVGYRRKKFFKAELTNFILDSKNGKPWAVGDVMHLRGELSYFKMVEKEYFENVIKKANEKWNVDVNTMFNGYLSA